MDEQKICFEIELPFLREIVSYLAKQPYHEVAAMISGLNQLREIPRSPDPRPPRATKAKEESPE